MLRTAALAAVVVLTASPLAARQQSPVDSTRTQKPAEQAQPLQPPRPQGQIANVKIEIGLTDQRGDVKPSTKTVTMIVADRETGRIRTNRGNIMLNIDARPDIQREGRVRVQLTLEYHPQGVSASDDPMPISETLTVILEEGRPIVVSQSADPTSDRTVKVELKATVMR
jgi:glucose/arabinose dehydrogenase